MTRAIPPGYRTDTETAEVVLRAQRLYQLADDLVTRAENLRDSAEALLSTAHVDVHLWSRHSEIPTQQPLDLR